VNTNKWLFQSIALLFISSLSWAGNTGLQGFNSRTFKPASDGSGIYNVTGTSILPHQHFTLGVTTNVASGLVRVVNPANNTTTKIIDLYLDQNFLFSLGLLDQWMVGGGIPFTFYQSGRNFNTQTDYTAASLGDVWLDAKWRFWQGPDWWPDLAFYSALSFPTGSRSQFTGDSSISWENKVIAEKSLPDVDIFANMGYRLVDSVQVLSTTQDDEFSFGIGGRYFLPWQNRSWGIETELIGKTILDHSTEVTTPIEWRLGGHKRLTKDLSVSSGLGVGLTEAFGTPGFRWFTGIRYHGPEGVKRHFGPPVLPKPDLTFVYAVHFLFNRYEPTPSQTTLLAEAIHKIVTENPKKILLYGHTDSYGEEMYNQVLGLKRAEAVKQILIQAGLKGEDIEIITKSFGAKERVASDATIEGQQQNRRVEIFIQK